MNVNPNFLLLFFAHSKIFIMASPFQVNKCKFYLHLAPVFSQDVGAGIRQKLNRYLLKYVRDHL